MTYANINGPNQKWSNRKYRHPPLKAPPQQRQLVVDTVGDGGVILRWTTTIQQRTDGGTEKVLRAATRIPERTVCNDSNPNVHKRPQLEDINETTEAARLEGDKNHPVE
jgi:hypothetical protein